MRITSIAVLLSGLSANGALAQSSCLEPDALVELDAEWERALLETNVAWLEAHLAQDFVWVHNHAVAVDTRASMLARATAAPQDVPSTRSRVQSEVEARVVGSTGLVTGFTVVDRGPGPTRYNFMRTYAAANGRCLLLGNHTMVVPEPEGSLQDGAS